MHVRNCCFLYLSFFLRRSRCRSFYFKSANERHIGRIYKHGSGVVCNHGGRSHNNLNILHYRQGQEKLFLTFRLTHNEPQDQNSSDLLPSEKFWQIMTKKSRGKVVWTNVRTICTRGFFFSVPSLFTFQPFWWKKVMYIVRYSAFFVF